MQDMHIVTKVSGITPVFRMSGKNELIQGVEIFVNCIAV